MDKPDYCPFCQSPNIEELYEVVAALIKWVCQACGKPFWVDSVD